jgi:hypothetical protein
VANTAAVPQSPLFNAYRNGPVHARVLQDLLTDMDRKGGISCGEKYEIQLLSLDVQKPIEIRAGEPAPDGGSWTEKLSIRRCRYVNVVNFLFNARGRAPMQTMFLVPGLTIAGPQLMLDVVPVARATAVGMASQQDSSKRNCANVFVADAGAPTIVNQGNSTTGRIWREIWTVFVCGTMVPLTVEFTENRRIGGTDFKISTK